MPTLPIIATYRFVLSIHVRGERAMRPTRQWRFPALVVNKERRRGNKQKGQKERKEGRRGLKGVTCMQVAPNRPRAGGGTKARSRKEQPGSSRARKMKRHRLGEGTRLDRRRFSRRFTCAHPQGSPREQAARPRAGTTEHQRRQSGSANRSRGSCVATSLRCAPPYGTLV